MTDLLLHAGRTVGDVQWDFNQAYPFLKVEFYKANVKPAPERRLNRDTLLYAAGIFAEGVIQLNDLMTVGELENLFRMQYGVTVQVSRKSGPIWLETTMTDRWTLKQQNDHGRELSLESGVGVESGVGSLESGVRETSSKLDFDLNRSEP